MAFKPSTLSMTVKCDDKHNATEALTMLCVIIKSVVLLCVIKLNVTSMQCVKCVKCRYAECHGTSATCFILPMKMKEI